MKLVNYIGQKHLIGENGPVKKMIDNGHFQSVILYGNPGIGKTTLANIIAESLEIPSFNVNAATLSSAELKAVLEARKIHDKIIIIMDEVHRLDKTKQNYLLPFLETDKVYLIGTTTENPYYSVNAALRSRLLLFKLNQIEKNELVYGMYEQNLKLDRNKKFNQDILEEIYYIAAGDVRMAFNILKFLITNYEVDEVSTDLLHELFESNIVYDKTDTHHYDLLSAFQKSIRASDTNAALHYLARLLIVGDFESLTRRLLVIAYEDIGFGNPNACNRCVQAVTAFERVGMPEGQIILSNAVVDLCLSPKSTSAYVGIKKAFDDIRDGKGGSIPEHIMYKQPDHDKYDREKAKRMDNLPKGLKGKQYFKSNESSNYERALNENYKKYYWDIPIIQNKCIVDLKKDDDKKIVSFSNTQLFVQKYLIPQSPYKGIFLYHSVGSGKTCTAIATATNTFNKEGYTILWVTRHTLKEDIWKNMFDNICNVIIQEKLKTLSGTIKIIIPDWLKVY